MTNAFPVGVADSLGLGKRLSVDALCKAMHKQYNLAVVTNNIYTQEDAQFSDRILVRQLMQFIS